ncbi:cytochrome c/c1 heme lyase-domain-containing protein [Suillus fuscotomentosus]|uniref:Holocytochrome c-type synthase n=1 Tax=Suillus fuscotomentosus TaxID=1912939 RepID=A0AAD4EDM5_9AGAM|nr:cytochrome c/c1 heme lyase-domain-containing protein [Suillus fuscotomentosus]KAG1904126.1 cytochrome c/c1 heme lyase-domain-containing protein [Suillus fuscotomentosus]
MADKCPVDHGSHSSDQSCPVDHKSRTTWASVLPGSSPTHPVNTSSLSTEREVSSIPRTDNGNWVYPSEAQFFAAMARKNHNPHAPDMKTIIPIHNAVNERAWSELMKWESGRGGEKCGGVKLVTFKGRPNDLTPKARLMTLLGYSAPFDRHDWVVERCGTRIRYVIDFYTGRGAGPSSNNVSFYLDVRPALDNWEGVKMRAENIWQDWFGSVRSTNTPSQS